ncbi:MAG TPA: caspase family protein [Polyangiaceae bacterium]|nr:caspase family protein [Polyangiaceae bacterium]
MSRARGWLLALALALVAPNVLAEITRYAVIAGNDTGTDGDLPLRYAEADAQKVYDVLSGLGEFRPENMVLLEGRGGSELSRVLIAMNARIRAESGAGRDAVLFVYYSGHADPHALHAGGEPLELELLERLVQGSSASFRILVLDACRSGSLTRVKGAQKTAPFPVALDAELGGEGLALLTSSTSDEDAQESDLLRGSFFTHYLVSGLRGAADRNADGSVSVEEAYGHAYQHTLRASSQTFYGTQHPTFRFDLKGKGAIVLTWVRPRAGRSGQITFPAGHAYLLFAGDEQGPVVAEVGEHDTRRLLALEPGTYFVRGRASDHLLEGPVELASGQTVQLDPSQLHPVEYARLARKGGTERERAHGPWLGYQLRTPLWSGATPCHGLRAGYALALPQVSLGAALGACRSTFDNDVLRARADELGIDASVAHVWDFAALSLAFGGAAGASWLRERFTTPGRAPGRDSLGLALGALLGASYELSHGYQLFGEALGQVLFFEQRRSDGAEGTVAQPALRLTLGAGKQF